MKSQFNFQIGEKVITILGGVIKTERIGKIYHQFYHHKDKCN